MARKPTGKPEGRPLKADKPLKVVGFRIYPDFEDEIRELVRKYQEDRLKEMGKLNPDY